MTVIRTRAQWGARPPAEPPARLTLPTRELWLHHTAGNERGATGMRAIQATHMDDREFADVGYSFVIDPATLTVYEGRGAWAVGAHTEGHNSRSHGICVMGNYDTTQPDVHLLRTIADLVAHGHRQGWWPDHLTGGHRDTKPTACPGRHLYAAIRRINAETEAILAGDTPTEPQETPPVAPTSPRDTPVGQSQQAINAWLPGARRIAVDGDWGPQSAAALEFVLDQVAGPTIRDLEQANAVLTATNTALTTRNKDLQAEIIALQHGADLSAETVTLAAVGALTRQWWEAINNELTRLDP